MNTVDSAPAGGAEIGQVIGAQRRRDPCDRRPPLSRLRPPHRAHQPAPTPLRGLVVDPLERVSKGVYRTTKPIPVHGTWKALIRLQRDNYVAGVPLYLPEDSAIPAAAVEARPTIDRPFVDETQILQRELKSGVPGYLAGIAYSVVAAIVLGLLLLLGWVVNRIARPEGDRDRRDPSPSRRGSPTREVTA